MKNWLLSFVAIAALLGSADAMARPRRAACAGGPRAPSYAFDRWSDANACARRIASASKECANAVRTGQCTAESYYVDQTPPYACVCGGGAAVGYWSFSNRR